MDGIDARFLSFIEKYKKTPFMSIFNANLSKLQILIAEIGFSNFKTSHTNDVGMSSQGFHATNKYLSDFHLKLSDMPLLSVGFPSKFETISTSKIVGFALR
jgi:hypothetical protein